MLGLIFLRHAYSRYLKVKQEVQESMPYHPQRGYKQPTKDDFVNAKALFLPEKAQWEYIAGLPEGVDVGEVLDNAMRAIEPDHGIVLDPACGSAGMFVQTGHSEKDIRQKIVETGAVDVMVSIGTKFFYTRSLPCTLWFFDREKENTSPDPSQKEGNLRTANTTLMLALREVYRKVSSNLHDFTPEHLKNIAAIVKLYRGNTENLAALVAEYIGQYYSLCSFTASTLQNTVDDMVKELGLNKNGEWRKLNVNAKLKELETIKDKISEYFKLFAYEERMAEIKIELQSLDEEAVQLAQTIQDNLNELGL